MRFRLVLIGLLTLLVIPLLTLPSWADEIDDLQQQIDKLNRQLEMSQQATKPLESTLTNLQQQVNNIRSQINKVKANLHQESIYLQNLEIRIKEEEKGAEEIKRKLDQQLVYNYRLSRSFSPLTVFLSFGFDKDTLLAINLEQGFILLTQRQIKTISRQLIVIKKNKQQLEKERKELQKKEKRLAAVETNLNKQMTFYQREIEKAKTYQKTLQEKIAELSRRQKELLAQKTGMFTTTVGEVPLAGDPHARPDYDPGFRPAFAAFSFGAPHHKGMSQYGAFGRAKKGQNYQDILKAYYGDVHLETVDTNFSISTDQGVKPFEDNYLKGIAEMPTKWADEGGFEALKAQAVAARSYALAYVGWQMSNRHLKGTICTSEHCQVYRSSKAANPGRWGDAVNQTKGQILVSNSNGEIVNAWYSSTSGGYMQAYSSLGHSTPAFWDTECHSQNCWPDQAYEKEGGSPWFYKGWYKDRSGKSCGHSHPWLNQDEMVDILNAAIVFQNNPDSQNHIYQTDGCLGSNPDTWSRNKMAQEADKYGGRVRSINKVTVKYSNAGYTSQVEFSTNRGQLNFSGDLFKLVFNLRAPGAVHIASPLYNIARK